MDGDTLGKGDQNILDSHDGWGSSLANSGEVVEKKERKCCCWCALGGFGQLWSSLVGDEV